MLGLSGPVGLPQITDPASLGMGRRSEMIT
jgi:hypothetical protein